MSQVEVRYYWLKAEVENGVFQVWEGLGRVASSDFP